MTFRSHRSSAFRSLWLAAWLVAVALVSFGATKSGPALPGETAPAPSPSAKPAAPPLTPEPAFGRNAPPASAKAAKAPTPTEEPAAAASQAASGPGEPGRATPARRASRPVSPSIATPRWSASREFPDFRIGYLPQPAEDGLDESMARRLADYLRRDKALAGAFRETGYSGEVAMQPADGYSDMANRLDHEQFDLAFCPAALFATKRDNYKAILQERHPGDIVDSRGDQPARRQGVIFVGPTSPLFHEEATTATLRRVLAESEFAVPSAHDAAGLLFPILALADEFGIPPKQLRLRFCGSSREVVKHVVSGLAEIGACDSATLDRWLADQAQGLPLGSLVRELPIPMRPVPTDPVIVRGSLDPAYSKLGQAMQEALQRFFRTREAAGFGLLRARDSFYDALGQDLARLEDLRERGLRGAAGTPAPAAETPPDQGARP